jgi:hypothetical protein
MVTRGEQGRSEDEPRATRGENSGSELIEILH